MGRTKKLANISLTSQTNTNTDMEGWKMFETLTKVLGEKIMLEAVEQWMNEDMLQEISCDISRNYDINIEDYEEIDL